MNVRELIAKLSEFDPDAEVRIPSQTGGYHSPFSVELERQDNPWDSDFDYWYVLIQ